MPDTQIQRPDPEKLLRQVCQITGGHYLAGGETKLDLGASRSRRYVELWPWLVKALLLVFLVDIAVRRWEHLTGIWEVIAEWFGKKRPEAAQR